MKFSKSIKALTLASLLAAVGVAQADTFTPVQVQAGTSFNDLVLGTITLSGTSNVAGDLGFIKEGTLQFGSWLVPVTFSTVTFSGSSLTTSGVSLSASGSSFSFTNLAAGTYKLLASGTAAPGIGSYVSANYTVTPVPEPESYAMFLAGLGIMGAIARRRKNWA